MVALGSSIRKKRSTGEIVAWYREKPLWYLMQQKDFNGFDFFKDSVNRGVWSADTYNQLLLDIERRKLDGEATKRPKPAPNPAPSEAENDKRMADAGFIPKVTMEKCGGKGQTQRVVEYVRADAEDEE